LCHLRQDLFFSGRLFPATKGVVSYYFRSIRCFFFSSDFLRRLLNLVFCIICLSGSSVCVWISVCLALFPPTRELYRISIHSRFVKFLTDASGFGVDITCLSQKNLCLGTRLCFGPLSHQQGTCIEFRSIRAWSDFLQMLLDLIFCIICLAFRSVFESRLFFALFPATLTLHFDPFSLSQISYRSLWNWNCIIF
jgi:hypothetical protein